MWLPTHLRTKTFQKEAVRLSQKATLHPMSCCPQVVEDDAAAALDRCEVELGACLWHDTNLAALKFLEDRRAANGAHAGLHVLELGAGAGALGIALALDGAHAVITDVDALVPLLELNCRENGFGGSASSSAAVGATPTKAAKAKKGKKPKKGRRDEDSFDDGSGSEGAPQEEEEAPLPKRSTAKDRKAERAAKKAAKSGGSNGYAATDAPVAPGSCVAQPAEWTSEAQRPTLPAAAFDVVIVCDSLYENRDSWAHLRDILQRTPRAASGEVVLASATLRRPFLKDFAASMVEVGFELTAQEVTEHAEVLSLKRTKAAAKPDVAKEEEAAKGADADDDS
eukprot:TRINITY_DN36682_c0_g1_i1.p1 TRINITY_DN36682_c0_g1~~TRINITY_DN36682_c0_g1_i1.p1  ORF type:complete len:339 (-),score=113.98 TRINITY_DN36682_c0_g1_i1:185-1201(-)